MGHSFSWGKYGRKKATWKWLDATMRSSWNSGKMPIKIFRSSSKPGIDCSHSTKLLLNDSDETAGPWGDASVLTPLEPKSRLVGIGPPPRSPSRGLPQEAFELDVDTGFEFSQDVNLGD